MRFKTSKPTCPKTGYTSKGSSFAMRKIVAGLALAAMASIAQPATAKSETSPYALVVVGTAVNVCMVRYGYFTSDKGVELLFKWARKKGLEPYQVANLMDHPDFDEDLDATIKGMGGCSQIVADITRDKSGRMKGLTGGENSSALGIYDNAEMRNKLLTEKRLYNPNIKKQLELN